MSHSEINERIWACVANIPKGKIASYGQIAELAGLPKHARLVGQVLKKLPKESHLPWHRVVNAAGKISLPLSHPGHTLQRQKLETEGIKFSESNRISMQHFRWVP